MSLDFEDAMAKVSTIAYESEVSIGDMREAILELSNETGIAATDIADNVYNAISAGQKTGDAVNFVSNATKLARAGFSDSADALDILTTIMNAYGKEADEVTNVSDMLIQTQNLGKTTVAELSSAMGKVIPTAKANGVELDSLCASYAVMTSNGIATAETTTYLNSMLNELGKQGTTAADAFAKGTEHIKDGGLTMAEAMEQGWELTDVLSILDEQASLSGTSISNMFGSAEAGKAASVLWDNAVQLNDAVDSMRESADATDIAFEKLDTKSYKIQKSLNELKNTGIELGDTIMESAAPLIDKLSEGIRKLSEWFSSLDDSQKQTIIQIAAFVAAISPVLIVGGKVASGIGSIISIGGKLIGVIAGFNPVVLAIVAVIGSLIAIGVTLYKNWDTIKEKATQLKNNMIQSFEAAKEKITSIFTKIKTTISDKINSAKDTVKSVIDKIKGFFNFKWELPKLKMPHVNITGSFSLAPPSVPKFSIDWYKKAMDDPMIMNSPTAFGINNLGQIMAGGEAGSEVVSGTDTLMNMIQEAVANENSLIAEKLERLINFLFAILPQMLDNMGNDIVLDDGVLVGRMAQAMDVELGRIASRKERL